ncbi:MAG: hypothetical protein V3W44_09690 [Dehalococcoidales bacterium]
MSPDLVFELMAAAKDEAVSGSEYLARISELRYEVLRDIALGGCDWPQETAAAVLGFQG